MRKARSELPKIKSAFVIPPHAVLTTTAKVIAFIRMLNESKPDAPFTRYEVGVRYSNGDEIRGQFKDKATAIAFLRGMR